MTPQHYFLSTAKRAEPSRWREAFPEGQALDATRLLAILQNGSSFERLLWLSTADVQWHANLAKILQIEPGERVVLLSGEPDEREGLRALNEGAQGYAHAYAVPEMLKEVALVVAHGGMWVGPQLMRRLISGTQRALSQRRRGVVDSAPDTQTSKDWASLSERETRVVRAVTAGHSNKEVADMLHISERTVKAHLGSVFEKLGVRDRLQLVLRLSMGAAPSTKA